MLTYAYRCPHCGAEDYSIHREEHSAFSVNRRCAWCGGWVRAQVSGPNLEFSVAKGNRFTTGVGGLRNG
jgi:predicted nucleic acid-binding Zn ribbon protein